MTKPKEQQKDHKTRCIYKKWFVSGQKSPLKQRGFCRNHHCWGRERKRERERDSVLLLIFPLYMYSYVTKSYIESNKNLQKWCESFTFCKTNHLFSYTTFTCPSIYLTLPISTSDQNTDYTLYIKWLPFTIGFD